MCIAEHPGSHVADLGLALVTSLRAEEVVAAHRRRGNSEYEEMRVVPEAWLEGFLAELGDGLVPSAQEFLVRAGLANRSPDSGR